MRTKIKIGEICDILNGYAFKSDKYVEEGIRIIRIANVQKGYLEDSTPQYYPLEAAPELSKYMLEENDLLMSLTGNVGRVALIPANMLPAALNQRVACLRIKDYSLIRKEFLYQLLNSDYFEALCILASKGIAQKNLSTEWLKEYEIPLFTQEEQIAISKELMSIDSLITARREQLAKLDELVKSRFVELFGDPEKNTFSWKEEELSKHLTVIGGYAFKSEQFSEEGIPVLRIGNINAGFFKPVNLVYWEDDDALNRYKMYPGDLVMSLTGTVGKDDYGNVCILGNDYDVYYLNQRNAKLEVQDTINKYYLSMLLKFEPVKKKLTGISRGVRQANISNKDILNLLVPIPPIELQNQFATFVEQTDKSKFEIQQSLEKLETLKKALMQKYFG